MPNRAPDFFIITPPRSGSTWLFENLTCHPEVFIPPMKEVKYFSNYSTMCDLKWYLDCFKKAGNRKKGDISPSYAILPDAAIEEVRELSPNLRLIALFRDPVERLWSHAKHQFHLKESVFSSFQTDAFDAVPEQKWLECLSNTWSLAYADYSSILKRWMRFFPKENIEILFFDDLVLHPKSLLETVLEHIGISGNSDWSSFPLDQRVNEGLPQAAPPAISNFLRPLLDGKTREFGEFVFDAFGKTIPGNWSRSADENGAGNHEQDLRQLYFPTDNDQILLKDILFRESIQIGRAHV